MTLNKQFKLLSIVTLLIAISVGFYFGLSDDRTAAVNPDNSSISTTEYTGDMIGAWTLGANVLLPSRFSGMGFSYVRNDTGFLYMMGGDMTGSGGNTPRNEVYNLRTNSWSVKAPMPGPMQYFGAPKLKDSLYTIAGMVNSFFTSACTNVRRYSIPQDAWVERAPVPAVNGWCESVGYQDSIIYAIGGCINGGSGAGSQVYVYNALNNTWRTGTPLPASKEGGALGVKGDTLVYVGGAADYFQAPTPTVYRGLISQSNRANITWTTGLDKPGLTRWRFDFHDWGCRGLILDMGGSTGFGLSTEVYVYSPGLNVWTLQPPSSISTSTMQSGSFALSNNIYKLVCASGLVLIAPYSIPQTQIFTDTFACPSASPITFCRNGLSKAINDNSWTYDTITVNLSPQARILDINVKIDTVWHTWDSDLSFYLRHLTSAQKVINRVGGSGDNFIGTILNDSATTPIASGSPPFTGSYQPSPPSLLSTLNNTSPNGTWVLAISDSAGGDTGLLKAWCITIHYDLLIGNENQQTSTPSTYSLNQNYPNPFNPTTSISFALPRAEDVKLVVYDILGREVATLVNEFKQAGIYEVPFNASSFSSGVYFYRLETGNFTQTKKMLLVK